eukprot:scaffold2506_cov236-Pinguiococcus_pyrenoidosus.AAC.12
MEGVHGLQRRCERTQKQHEREASKRHDGETGTRRTRPKALCAAANAGRAKRVCHAGRRRTFLWFHPLSCQERYFADHRLL